MLGLGEIIFIGSILVLFFSARKLPQLGSALGSTLRLFKEGVKGKDGRPVRDVDEYQDPDDSNPPSRP